MNAVQTALQAACETVSKATGIAVASILLVLNDWKNGYFSLLVPADTSDMRRARITAYCTKDGIAVRINVAPGRIEGSGTRVTAYQHIGNATPENAAKAIALANDWDSKAQTTGFAVSGFGSLDSDVTLWVRRGGKGRARRNATSNPFATTAAPTVDATTATTAAPTVDIIAGMSAASATSATVEPSATVERETVGAGSGNRGNRGNRR